MKRGTSVRVTDPQSANFGKVGTFLFKANENHVHVVIDGHTHTFHRLAVAPCNTYTPPIQDVKISNKDESLLPAIESIILEKLQSKLEKLYYYALTEESLSKPFDTDYARGVHSVAKKVREELYNILNGK
jgi:hypothetical protein